ncbi:MAG: CDGSH iron-sulfur domain-containing protein [Gemmatimonadota bacterium]
MSRRLRTYESDDVSVTYDPRRCIHSAECVRGLRRVFDPDRKPWIDPEHAGADAIAEVIERCPTGALHYERKDGGPAEKPDSENVARVGADGPVYARGRIRVELPGGDVLEETRVAFCRCGASQDKPFCDGSHEEAGFRDPGAIRGGRLVPLDELSDATASEAEPDPHAGTVTFRCAPNGPLLVRGPLRIEGTDGSRSTGHKGALCRCGHSETRPFCDGSHRDTGFEAD